MKNLNSRIAIVLVIIFLPMRLSAIEPVIDNDNDNSFLLVFVPGLGGAETWDSLISIMSNDESLKKFDAYVFDSLGTGGGIRQSSAELKRFLNSDRLSVYKEVEIVAHSIGGIIVKDYLLGQLETSSPAEMREKYVLFIGTPHIKDGFTAPPLEKLFAYIFYFTLSDLAKDALNSPEIRDINQRWISIVEKNEAKRIKNMALFGNDDNKVRPEDLSDIFVGEYLVIQGNHLGIAQSSGESGCTYQIIKRKLLNPDASLADLNCSAD
jgi:pimeloyl-ACP methyl ester carboxylesterase